MIPGKTRTFLDQVIYPTSINHGKSWKIIRKSLENCWRSWFFLWDPCHFSTARHATRRDAVPHGARQAIAAKVGSSWSFTQDGPR